MAGPYPLSVWPETPGKLHEETEMKYKHLIPSYEYLLNNMQVKIINYKRSSPVCFP